MSLRPFESELLERFSLYGTAPDMLTGRRGVKGDWIRGHLAEVRQDYPYRIYRYWVMFCNKAAGYGAKIKSGDYQSFRTYFYLLNRLGLVTLRARTRAVIGEPGAGKHIYVLTPGLEGDPRWGSPFQEVYPSSDWSLLTQEEKRERRRMYSMRKHAEAEA